MKKRIDDKKYAYSDMELKEVLRVFYSKENKTNVMKGTKNHDGDEKALYSCNDKKKPATKKVGTHGNGKSKKDKGEWKNKKSGKKANCFCCGSEDHMIGDCPNIKECMLCVQQGKSHC